MKDIISIVTTEIIIMNVLYNFGCFSLEKFRKEVEKWQNMNLKK